jgi:hypothetical protein
MPEFCWPFPFFDIILLFAKVRKGSANFNTFGI